MAREWDQIIYRTTNPGEIADKILGGVPPDAEKKTVLKLDGGVWNFGYRSDGLTHQADISPEVARILAEKGYPIEEVKGSLKI